MSFILPFYKYIFFVTPAWFFDEKQKRLCCETLFDRYQIITRLQ
jgi:hypothetical protein